MNNDDILRSITLPSISAMHVSRVSNKKKPKNNVKKNKKIDFFKDVTNLIGGADSLSSILSENNKQHFNSESSDLVMVENTDVEIKNELNNTETRMLNNNLISSEYIAPNLLKKGGFLTENIYSSDANEILKKIT